MVSQTIRFQNKILKVSLHAEVFIQETENQDRNKFENCKHKNPFLTK